MHSSDDSFVQPVTVFGSDHTQTVFLAALAAASAWVSTRVSHEDAWDSWFSGRITKTVRSSSKPSKVLKSAQFAVCAFVLDDGVVSSVDPGSLNSEDFGSGSSAQVALGFVPCKYEDMPRPVRALQVSGLDYDGVPSSFGVGVPSVVVDRSLGLSTGKASAQASHALGLWLREQSDEFLDRWAVSPSFSFSFDDVLPEGALVCITDAGFTEVAPGTSTAVAF